MHEPLFRLHRRLTRLSHHPLRVRTRRRARVPVREPGQTQPSSIQSFHPERAHREQDGEFFRDPELDEKHVARDREEPARRTARRRDGVQSMQKSPLDFGMNQKKNRTIDASPSPSPRPRTGFDVAIRSVSSASSSLLLSSATTRDGFERRRRTRCVVAGTRLRDDSTRYARRGRGGETRRGERPVCARVGSMSILSVD